MKTIRVIGFVNRLAPINPRGAERSLPDILHLIVAFTAVLSMLLFIGFGSGAGGREFRI